MFERTEDGHYCHPRVIADYQRLIGKHESRAEAGQKGGTAKARLQQRQSIATAKLQQRSSIQNQIQEPEPALPEQPHGHDFKTNHHTTAVNTTEAGCWLCQREGWAGTKIHEALTTAINYEARGQESPDLLAIGDDLVTRWRKHEASGEYPNDPGTYYAGGHYQKRKESQPSGPAIITDSRALVQGQLERERQMWIAEGTEKP